MGRRFTLPYWWSFLIYSVGLLRTSGHSSPTSSARNHLACKTSSSSAVSQWVRIPDLFDYMAANLVVGMQRHPVFQRWLEVVNKLDENPDLSSVEVDVVKAVGILGVLAEGSHIRATPSLISYAITDEIESSSVAEALQSLTDRSLLVYRRFNDSYRVWEGSDVDISARVDEARGKTAGQYGLAEALSRLLPRRPVVARRHSHETGALRFADVRYLDEPIDVADLTTSTADGIIACCLPANTSVAEEFRSWATGEEVADRKDIVVALPEQIGQLREATAELVALHWVRENTPSLRDDRVARRELDSRTADVERVVVQLIDRLMDPRPEPAGSACSWYWKGEASPSHQSAWGGVAALRRHGRLVRAESTHSERADQSSFAVICRSRRTPQPGGSDDGCGRKGQTRHRGISARTGHARLGSRSRWTSPAGRATAPGPSARRIRTTILPTSPQCGLKWRGSSSRQSRSHAESMNSSVTSDNHHTECSMARFPSSSAPSCKYTATPQVSIARCVHPRARHRRLRTLDAETRTLLNWRHAANRVP